MPRYVGTPFIIQANMKLKFYILFALCFMLVNGALAQGYTVSRVGKTDTIMVTVSRDCSIPVSDFATALGVEVYRDAERGGDGNLFASKIQMVNEPFDLEGFAFEKLRMTSPATVKIDFEKIKDDVTLKFYKAQLNGTMRYCSGQTFLVNFRKKQNSFPGTSQSNTGEKLLTIEELSHELNKMKHKLEIMDRDVVKHNEAMMLIPVFVTPVFLTLLALLIIGGIIYRKNKKKLKSPSDKSSASGKEEGSSGSLQCDRTSSTDNSSQKKKKNILTEEDLNKLLSKNLVPYLEKHLTEDKLNRFLSSDKGKNLINTIVECIKKEQEISSSECNQQPQSPQPPLPTLTMNTDDVKYDFVDNSFSLGKPETRIFRIYSDEGNYYYTIVEDLEIRKELAKVLKSYENCITSQPSNCPADRVEPVKSGKLIKDGNKFHVDVNNKLLLKFQ